MVVAALADRAGKSGNTYSGGVHKNHQRREGRLYSSLIAEMVAAAGPPSELTQQKDRFCLVVAQSFPKPETYVTVVDPGSSLMDLS
jgi:hypothetical protein